MKSGMCYEILVVLHILQSYVVVVVVDVQVAKST
jgi:hypothetical protein